MKNLIIVLTGTFIISFLIHLWIRENIKPYIKMSYENLYKKHGNAIELGKWDFKFSMYDFPLGEIANIINDSLDFGNNESSSLKIHKIGNYILNYTEGRIGKPDFDLLKNKSPIEQLQLIQDGKSHVWCGLFSFYYSYFLDGAGISSRYISIEKPGDTIIGTHVITEIYVPDESKWIYSDLTFDIIYVKNAGGKLNLVELVNAIKQNDKDLIFLKNDLNKGLVQRSIKEMDKEYIHFMKSQSEIRYFTGEQLRNNFIPFSKSKKIFETIFPSSSYYLYANRNNNINHLLFAGSRLLMILSFFILMSLLLYKLFFGFFIRKS